MRIGMQEHLDAALYVYSNFWMRKRTLLEYRREFIHALAQINFSGGQASNERQQTVPIRDREP
jgi:hypothetical protein